MPIQWGYLNNKRIKFYRHNKSWIFMSCRARYSQCCYDYSRCKIMIAPRVWNVHAIDAKIPCTFLRFATYANFFIAGPPQCFVKSLILPTRERIMHIIQLVIETKALFIHGTVVGWAPSQVPSSRQESAYHEPIRLLIVKYWIIGLEPPLQRNRQITPRVDVLQHVCLIRFVGNHFKTNK